MTIVFRNNISNFRQRFSWFLVTITAFLMLPSSQPVSAQVKVGASVVSFTVTPASASLTALVGGSGVSDSLTVAGLSSFKGNVTLVLSGVPSSVSVGLSKTVVTAGSTVTLSATASSHAAPGTYPIKITGTYANSTSAGTVDLVIPIPSFALSESAKSITLAPGQNGYGQPIAIAVVNPVGLANPVTLAVSGLPASVTSALVPVNATTQGLTFNVGTTVVPGTYPITVKGTSGTATSSTTVSLVVPAPGFTLSPTVTSFTLPEGGLSASTTINVVDTNGFNGIVNFALSGMPSGLTAALSAASNEFKTGLTFTPASTVAPGAYKVVVTGTSGKLSSAATILVTVPKPAFSVASAPAALTALAGGASVTSTVSVANVTGIGSGSVGIAVSGAPAGVTATLNGSSASDTSSLRLTVTAAGAAAPGTYPLTITGTGGATTVTATLQLTIPKPSFTLSASESSVTLTVGENGYGLPIGISVVNAAQLSSPVSFSLSGVPANVTANLNAINSTTQGLTFVVDSNAVPGTYPVTVKGASGSLLSSVAVSLIIPSPSFTLSPTVSSFTLVGGGSAGVSEINVVDKNGFNGLVNFSISGLPAGVTASWSSTSNVFKTGLTLTPGTASTPGNYNVVLTGTSGSLTSSTTLALTVSAPSFALSASPAALTALAGGNYVTSTVSVANVTGTSNGLVNLALSGAPAGVTAQLNGTQTNSASPLRLTVTAASTATPGTYPLTITGTAGGATHTATVQLTVPKPGFTLSASANSISLTVGQNGWNQPIDITAVNPVGLVNSITFAVAGVPANVSSAFTPLNATEQGLTFNVGTNAAPGTYPVVVQATSGSVTGSTTVSLVIPAPAFTLTAAATKLSLAAGTSGTSAISIGDLNGFAGTVKFSLANVPAGLAATLSTPSNQFSNLVTFQPSASLSAGTYNVQVVGQSGLLTSSATVAVTVTPPSFTVTSSPSSLTLVKNGSSASSNVNIDGLPANSTPALTVTGLPSGVTAGFASAVASSQNTVTFAAGSAAGAGSYTATVQATVSGMTKTTTIGLTIPTQSFTLSSSSTSLTLLDNGSASATISIANLGSSSSGVALTATGLPSGVTAVFASPTTTTSSALTFSAASSATPGTYTVAVTGTSGSLTSAVSIALTVKAVTVGNPTSIAITQPTYGFNLIPGSVRRMFATVTGGVSNGVNWSVTGGATLSAGTGNWVDVTAPATGSSCSINGSVNYTVSSPKMFTITAQSQENTSIKTTITVNVCNPAITVNVVPFYTTLYAGQKADIQSFIWGSVNHDVTWAITSQPHGGNGTLSDDTNQDTVFSATFAGRYTLTATSVADNTKTNTATIFVTGHNMPYEVTPSETEPVDCSVDPALTGTTYDVGPSQAYKTVQQVPWPTLTAGSTVRIHNEDTTGSSPTTYNAYFQVLTNASRTQPVRVCGVPDASGNLPVIDANGATGNAQMNPNAVGYAAVNIGNPGWYGLYTAKYQGGEDIIIEGLKIQNAKPPYSYTAPGATTSTPWQPFVACIRLWSSVDTVVRGLDTFNCGLGIFSDFNAEMGYAVLANTLYEGNHVHQNGISGSDGEHQFYIQGWNELVQFNVLDDYQAGASGSNFKSRGYPDIVRYNHFGDGAARQLDMIDNTDAWAYNTFESYLSGGVNSPEYGDPTQTYTADMLAAAVEAHHGDYAYGNTFVNTTAYMPIHYSTDHGSMEADRIGSLWFYNNSFYEPSCNPCASYSWGLFDTSAGGGDFAQEVEFPQLQLINNAIWMDNPTKPYFEWNGYLPQITNFGVNMVTSNWGNNDQAGGSGTGWAPESSPYNTSPWAFQGSNNTTTTSGVANLVDVPNAPFNTSTFVPNESLINAGQALPAAIARMPVRFQYGPSAIPVARVQPLTVGALE